MPSFPAGTVTFLFTDIEGSTRRWEQHPAQMQLALARHNAILQQAIETNGGYVFKTVGDAYCAAFGAPSHALNAARQAQRALHAEQWPEEAGPLKVRMALHSGIAELQHGDYFGQPLNRVARLLSTAHGGQTLLSLATQELVRDVLPTGVNLLDLGEHRLKDLIRPERIFQVVADNLPIEFPPLKTLDNRPNNLPIERSPLIGRTKELDNLQQLLLRDDVGLVTLTGPGGTGKTRLALQLAAEVIDHFLDGVFFVNLAPISDPGLVTSEVAQALGVRESGGRTLIDGLKDYLRDKQLLIVLDNFEQVLDAASTVAQLLASSRGLKVLVTSRARLQLKGEKEYPVPPLGLPPTRPAGETTLTIEQLTQYEAVRLFIERATDVKPTFEVTNENAPAVAEICTRLDGLPLAIELAASRIKILPPQAMLTRLQNRLKLLTGGARDVPARQQTLRDAIEWSYDLLTEGEKRLFRRMAVFVGGRTLEALEAVCNAEGDLQVDVLDGVESLVSKSLLRQEEGAGGEPRFVILETIHEFAKEKLEETGETEELSRAHAAYFLTFVESAEPYLRGAEVDKWLPKLEADHNNLRTAMSWALKASDVETALRIASGLWAFWEVLGYLSEGRRWLEEGLVQDNGIPRSVRAKALYVASTQAWRQADFQRTLELASESKHIYEELGDKAGIAYTLNELAIAALLADRDASTARRYLEDSLALFREVRDMIGATYPLSNLGEIERIEGDYEQALFHYEEALSLLRALGYKSGIIIMLTNYGHVQCALRDYEGARLRFVESLNLARDIGFKQFIGYSLGGLAGVAGGEGHPERAARLFGAAAALLSSIDASLEGSEYSSEYERILADIRAQMVPTTLEGYLQEGRALGMEQAIAYALEEIHEATPPAP